MNTLRSGSIVVGVDESALAGQAVRWAAEHRWPCVAEKICELYSTLRPAALRHLSQGRCFT